MWPLSPASLSVCAPLSGEMFGARVAAIEIVVGDDDVRGKRQAPLRHRLESARALVGWPALAAGVGPELGVVEVGGGDEKRSDDAVPLQFVGRKDDGGHADRMRDDDDRLRCAAREFRHAIAPGFDVRDCPSPAG